MRDRRDTGTGSRRPWGRAGATLALVAALGLGAGGCCLDDGSGCDSDAECCSDYCDPDYGDCVSAATRASRANRDPRRTLAQRTEPRQAKLGFECLKRRLTR